jgi:CheY-like chemotaxis protein
MTINEAKDFYKTDTRQYDFNCRENFKPWFKKTFKDGENSYLNINGLNKLVNKIVSWYEFKFPNVELDDPCCIDKEFENMRKISGYLNIKQLRYRLTYGERETMDCNYRTSSGHLGYDDIWYAGIRVLKNGKHKCLAKVNNGIQLMAELEKALPDVVFLDINMPEMDGLSALAKIRTEYPNLKVIIISADTSSQTKDKAAALGAAGYITKPFMPEHIETIIETVFQ